MQIRGSYNVVYSVHVVNRHIFQLVSASYLSVLHFWVGTSAVPGWLAQIKRGKKTPEGKFDIESCGGEKRGKIIARGVRSTAEGSVVRRTDKKRESRFRRPRKFAAAAFPVRDRGNFSPLSGSVRFC